VTPEGFIEFSKYALSKKAEVKRVCVKGYGATKFLFDLIGEMNQNLKEIFPGMYLQIKTIAALKLQYQAPIKNMDFCFKQSYISETLRGVSLGQKKVSLLLRELGRQRERISEFFKRMLHKGSYDYMLMDARIFLVN